MPVSHTRAPVTPPQSDSWSHCLLSLMVVFDGTFLERLEHHCFLFLFFIFSQSQSRIFLAGLFLGFWLQCKALASCTSANKYLRNGLFESWTWKMGNSRINIIHLTLLACFTDRNYQYQEEEQWGGWDVLWAPRAPGCQGCAGAPGLLQLEDSYLAHTDSVLNVFAYG